MGSEPGMAWNWCVNLANYCELHIITEGEFKDKIEAELPTLPQGKNMHFYYNPVSEKIRKMCWNQGDWRFYYYYRQWQYKTYQIALSIIQKEKIDILHQLNMVGFRESGYLWKIKIIPFVWGPIGGIKQFPVNYLKGAGFKMQLFYHLKNIINILQIKYDYRVNMAFKRASVLISSIPDSYRAIKKYKYRESVISPDTGCFVPKFNLTERFNSPDFHIIWAGKFDFRKQLPLALKAIALTNNRNLILDVFGSGNELQVIKAKKLAEDLGITSQVVWHGNQPHDLTMKAMRNSQLFFFTSISEDASTVIMEAVTCFTPALCFNTNGMGYVVNDSIGIKIKLSNPQQSINEFAEKIEYLYHHREVLQQMSQNCMQRQQELSWENKAKQMVELYKRAVKNTEKQHS
jgi:glycosyltransferase involved in cell wall biosynthesis